MAQLSHHGINNNNNNNRHPYTTFNTPPTSQANRLQQLNETSIHANELRVILIEKRAALASATDNQQVEDIGKIYIEITRLQKELDEVLVDQQRLTNLVLNYTLVERIDRARRIVLRWGYNAMPHNDSVWQQPLKDNDWSSIRPIEPWVDSSNVEPPIPQPRLPLRVWFVAPFSSVDNTDSSRVSYYGFFPGKGKPIPNPQSPQP